MNLRRFLSLVCFAPVAPIVVKAAVPNWEPMAICPSEANEILNGVSLMNSAQITSIRALQSTLESLQRSLNPPQEAIEYLKSKLGELENPS